MTWCVFCILAATLVVGAILQGLLSAAPAHAAAPAGKPKPAAARPATPPAGGESVDRVVAIVNDDPILSSEVDERFDAYEAGQGQPITDPAAVKELRDQILQQLIDEKIILDEAKKQNMTAPEEQVKAQVDEAVKNTQGRFPDEKTFLEELKKQGTSVEQLKTRYAEEIRKQILAQKLVDREIRSKIKLTDTDVDTFYAKHKSELPKKSGSYHLAQILVRPKPDATKRAAAKGRAREALTRLQAGDNWDAVVKKYSDDDVTAPRSGDLGEVPWGSFEPDFEKGVETLLPGKISDIIETRFGYHIAQMVARDTTGYHVRHILVATEPSPADEKAAIDRAEKAHDQAVAGTAWQTLVNSYSDDKETVPQGGDIGDIPFDKFPNDYLSAFDSLSVGGISPVMKSKRDGAYRIFKILGRTSGGDYKLEDIRDQLKNMLMQQKLGGAYDTWMEGLRKKAFVERKDK